MIDGFTISRCHDRTVFDHGIFIIEFLLTWGYHSVTLWAMDKATTVSIRVTTTDLIDDTTSELFNGTIPFDGSTIRFIHKDNTFTITKIGSHYLTIETDGAMHYTLDLKPQVSYDCELTVESFSIPIEVKATSMELHSTHWDVTYMIYQQDSLLYHNRLYIEFLMN